MGSEVQYASWFEINGRAHADVCPAQDESSQHAKQHQLDSHAMRGEKHTEKRGKTESLNTLIVCCGQLGRHLIKRQNDRRLGLH